MRIFGLQQAYTPLFYIVKKKTADLTSNVAYLFYAFYCLGRPTASIYLQSHIAFIEMSYL